MPSRSFIGDVIGYFVSNECGDKYNTDDKFDEECIQLLSSKVVGYLIMLSVFGTLKQLSGIYFGKSGKGVSFTSMLMLGLTSLSTVGYSIAQKFPISTWGESAFLNVLFALVCYLILYYDRSRHNMAIPFLSAYTLATAVLVSGYVPMFLHKAFQMLSIPAVIWSKIIQIATIYAAGDTGMLSLSFMAVATFRTGGRLFNHITETGDIYRITQYAVAFLLNVLIILQFVYYKRIKAKKLTVIEKEL